jgi:1,4-alpha-glucan branching enzyme
VLPLSHDEVVYGKNSLINKMPGDNWQQFANLRLLYGYMYGHPGAKLLFMGGEFGQHHEWQHDYSLDWHEDGPLHEGLQKFMTDLNSLYKIQPALYEQNYNASGFEWIAFDDTENSVLSWLRKGTEPEQYLLFVANFTPIVRDNYRIGVPMRGYYKEILNSDNLKYGGSDVLNAGDLDAYPIPLHGKMHSLCLTLPPLGITVVQYYRDF